MPLMASSPNRLAILQFK
uniref:Uncharacterized protein n=1 Tax=Rhizophora mucronata TaxID=61149 RepID=A0A2P2NAZ6_RHIMU